METKCVAEVCEIISGGTPKTSVKEYWNGNIGWLSVKDFGGGKKHVYESEKSITELGVEKSSTNILKIDDIILSARGTVGEMAMIGTPMAFNQSCFGLRTKDYSILDQEFLFYALKNAIRSISSITQGSVFETINRASFEKIFITFTDLQTQKKIAKILSDIDAKIENNNAINRNLSEQLKAIFDAWFYKMTPFGGKEPDGTEYITIEHLCSSVTKGTTPTTLGMPFTDEGINFIKGESIQDNHCFDRSKLSYIDEITHDKLKRSQIQSGDIVFTIAGTLGRFALIDSSMVPANTNQAVAIIRAEKVTPEYLYSFFIGNWHNDYYTKRIQQAVQANLSLGTIKSLPIAVLPRKYYEEYLSIINPLISETKRLEIENLRLSELRDSLLPKLMSGELDVSALSI